MGNEKPLKISKESDEWTVFVVQKDSTGSSVKIDQRESQMEPECQTSDIIKALGLGEFMAKKGNAPLNIRQDIVTKSETVLGVSEGI